MIVYHTTNITNTYGSDWRLCQRENGLDRVEHVWSHWKRLEKTTCFSPRYYMYLIFQKYVNRGWEWVSVFPRSLGKKRYPGKEVRNEVGLTLTEPWITKGLHRMRAWISYLKSLLTTKSSWALISLRRTWYNTGLVWGANLTFIHCPVIQMMRRRRTLYLECATQQ